MLLLVAKAGGRAYAVHELPRALAQMDAWDSAETDDVAAVVVTSQDEVDRYASQLDFWVGKGARMYSVDFVINTLLMQRLDFDNGATMLERPESESEGTD